MSIVLKEHYDKDGRYLGKEVVHIEKLTPEFLDKIKGDKEDKMGWKRHRKAMKDHGHDIGDADEQ